MPAAGSWIDPAADVTEDELTLTTESVANGGSCVARHEGRVVFVRYALPGETVRARIRDRRGSYWHADVVEVIDAAPDRIESLCPIAGPDGSGCCDFAFVEPVGLRALKGQVVANQLQRLADVPWPDGAPVCAEPVGSGGSTGWRTRVRLAVGSDGRPGFHRYHSSELISDLRCAQVPAGMLADLPVEGLSAGDQLHVVDDDAGARHVLASAEHRSRVLAGSYDGVQVVGQRRWRVPVTAFWQAHRDAATVYSALVAEWAQVPVAGTAWDLYGGAGVFAAVLGDAVGSSGEVLSVDTSRAGSRAGRAALSDLGQVRFVVDSVRRGVGRRRRSPDTVVLDPPRTGAGREVIELISGAGADRVIHFGCEAAAFARDIGLYRRHGYRLDTLRVFDAFPLTHHVEGVALLVR